MPIKIKAERVHANQLKPGDLFSTADQNYWNTAMVYRSIGERVFIRTNVPADEALDGAQAEVYRITIEQVQA